MSSPPVPSDAWRVEPLSTHAFASPLATAREDTAGWQPLRQAWRETPQPGFQPARVRIRWSPDVLCYDVVLSGAQQHNRARRLNELTWELGDVCEIFLYDIAAGFYIELHITPENQRLQLRLPLGAIEAVRQGKARVEDFMVDDPDWVHTTVECAADTFAVRALIPARNFTKDGLLSPSVQLRTAVCRYDYRGAGPEPILSSSAALRAPSFHAPEAWTALVLQR